MNSFATIIFKVMLAGLQGLLNSFWGLGGEGGESGLIAFLRTSWPVLVIALCVGGFIIDRIVYLLRWRPYYVWSTTLRRWRQKRNGSAEESQPSPEEEAAYAPDVPEEAPAAWAEPTRRGHPAPMLAQETRRGAAMPLTGAQPTRVGMPFAAPITAQQDDRTRSYPAQGAPAARPASPYAPNEPEPVYRHRSSYPPPRESYAPPQPAPAQRNPRVRSQAVYQAPYAQPINAEQGMAELMDGITPSFGARQPAPPAYQTDLPLNRAPEPARPPQWQPNPPPVSQPETPVHPGLNPELFRRNLGLNEHGLPEENSGGAFFPNTTFVPYYQSPQQAESPSKAKKGLRKLVSGAGILSGDDEREGLSIHDLQKTTDFRSAFHAPVYPKRPQAEEDQPK